MSVELNRKGYNYALRLIREEKVNRTSDWEMTPADENAILGEDRDWGEYARWFLGIDTAISEETKAHYKYPFGKRGKLYRSALIAIRQRSAQQGLTEIYEASGRLLVRVDEERSLQKVLRKVREITRIFR